MSTPARSSASPAPTEIIPAPPMSMVSANVPMPPLCFSTAITEIEPTSSGTKPPMALPYYPIQFARPQSTDAVPKIGASNSGTSPDTLGEFERVRERFIL